jgi:hypothetical protein
MTVDAVKRIKLFIDGTQYGSTTTYTGTLDVPTIAGTAIGSAGPGTQFTGMIDDVQFSSYAIPDALIRTYAATKRPHHQLIWTSDDYATGGQTLGAACSTGTQCADIVYDGPDIHQEGARYYLTMQLGTPEGIWSAPTTDWFETSDAISVSSVGTLALPRHPAGEDATDSVGVTTVCAVPTGCDLHATAPSDTVAMATVAGPQSIPRIPASVPSAWAPGDPQGMGVTVLASTSGKDSATWGAGADLSDLSALNFVGLRRSSTSIQHRASSGTEITLLGIRLNAPLTTPPGPYQGSVSLIAVAAP